MEFKLSAREVLILEDRDKILRELRRGRQQRGARQRARGHRRPTRPPVLVVPQDQSGLIQVIERDRSYSDGEVEAGTANRKKKERQEEEGTVWRRWWRDLEEKEEEVREGGGEVAVFLASRSNLKAETNGFFLLTLSLSLVPSWYLACTAATAFQDQGRRKPSLFIHSKPGFFFRQRLPHHSSSALGNLTNLHFIFRKKTPSHVFYYSFFSAKLQNFCGSQSVVIWIYYVAPRSEWF